MANIRSLKKDIDFLMTLVLQDCISIMENYPETDKEKVMEIARKVIQDHRLLRTKVCHREIDPVMPTKSAFYVTNQPSSGYWPIISQG